MIVGSAATLSRDDGILSKLRKYDQAPQTIVELPDENGTNANSTEKLRLPGLESAGKDVSQKPMIAYYVPFYKAAAVLEDGDTLLDRLVDTGQADAFDNMTARAVVQHFWKEFASPKFNLELGMFVIYLGLLVIVSFIVSGSGLTFSESDGSRRAAILLIFLAIFGFLLRSLHGELKLILLDPKKHRMRLIQAANSSKLEQVQPVGNTSNRIIRLFWTSWRSYREGFKFNVGYFLKFWNYFELIRIFSTLLFMLFYLTDNKINYPWTLATSVYFSWVCSLFYLRAIEATAIHVSAIIRTIKEVKWFIAILILSVFATSNSLFALLYQYHNNDPSLGKPLEFFHQPQATFGIGSDIIRTLFDTFTMIMLNSNYDINVLAVGSYSWLVRAIYIFSMLGTLIVLLNLLIGSLIDGLLKIAQRLV